MRSNRRSACSRSASTSSVSIVSMSRSGSTRPSGWITFSSPCARTTCTIASVSRMFARKRLPSPSPSCAPGDETCDVVEVDRVPHDLRGAHRLRHLLEALVADRHDGDVRLDRREGIVGGLGSRFRQRVEQRGLARVGHPDDADPRAQARSPPSAGPPEPVREGIARVARRPRVLPRSAPASTSEGWWTPRYTLENDRAVASPYSGAPWQAEPRVRDSAREGRRGVGAGEAQAGRRRGQRWQAREAGAATAGERLDRRVQRVGAGDGTRRRAPAASAPPVEQLAGEADGEPQGAVLAERREAGDRPLGLRAVPAGAGEQQDSLVQPQQTRADRGTAIRARRAASQSRRAARYCRRSRTRSVRG